MQKTPLSVSVVQSTYIVMPEHTNPLKSIFGGVLMSWIDTAASISAMRYARAPVVTARLEALDFINPAYVGWFVELNARVTFVATSSMEVMVEIYGENLKLRRSIAKAFLTFVSLDENGIPKALPRPQVTTETEQSLFAQGSARRLSRIQNKTTTKKSKPTQ